jgi:hypothetical protein
MPECALIDLLGRIDRDAETILEWPEAFIGPLKRRLLALHSDSPLSADDLAELKTCRLLDDATGRPTALGEYLMDLCVREGWQEGGEFEKFRQFLAEECVGSVLEVGCSSGWILRTLWPSPAIKRVGIDIDAKALALGCRLAGHEDRACCFYCCSAHSLPLDIKNVDVVICRNALTYVHQRTALREMCRTLKPNGFILIRFENIWFDLMCLFRPNSFKSMCCRLRDFCFGLVHAALAWQPIPGSTLTGGRAFGTVRSLKWMLRRYGCEVIHVVESERCVRFLGFLTQTSVLARKIDNR